MLDRVKGALKSDPEIDPHLQNAGLSKDQHHAIAKADSSVFVTTGPQSAINWPRKYLPGATDNFVTNERIERDITAAQIWALLADITQWHKYYDHNTSDITPPKSGSFLQKGDTFRFSTFGFPTLPATVRESVPPAPGQAGRLGWDAELGEAGTDDWVGFYHGWLVEDLEGGRVRILTQESQAGKPAAETGALKPNKMLLGHQDWLDGLVTYARGKKVNYSITNLGLVKDKYNM